MIIISEVARWTASGTPLKNQCNLRRCRTISRDGEQFPWSNSPLDEEGIKLSLGGKELYGNVRTTYRSLSSSSITIAKQICRIGTSF